jgi:hypothetical protein
VKTRDTLLFFLLVLSLLGIISAFFPEEGIRFKNQHLYFPTLKDLVTENGYSSPVLQRIKNLEDNLHERRRRDSAYVDSLASYTQFFQTNPARIHLPGNDWGYLNDFFAEADRCRNGKNPLHVLHYGDSQIETDRITGYIRRYLQERFGGGGPGLLPAIQIIPTASVAQSASGITGYVASGMHQNRASHGRYGALGQMGAVNGEAGIRIAARDRKSARERVGNFQTIRLFVGQEKKFKVELSSGDQIHSKEKRTGGSSPVKVYTWRLDEPISRFSLRLSGAGEVYGIAVDGVAGLAVDNIPFRGSSGIFFDAMDASVASAMFKELNARLILLEFGGNKLPSIRGEKSIRAYCNQLSEQIAYLKRACPKAKILLIGPADMSTKINGKLRTYPYLEPLIDAMKETAVSNGAAFWNMYEVMGGRDSMIGWVKSSPALAAPDYIHFTYRGSERIAALFCETLMVYYDYYRFVTENKAQRR